MRLLALDPYVPQINVRQRQSERVWGEVVTGEATDRQSEGHAVPWFVRPFAAILNRDDGGLALNREGALGDDPAQDRDVPLGVETDIETIEVGMRCDTAEPVDEEGLTLDAPVRALDRREGERSKLVILDVDTALAGGRSYDST